MPFTLLQAVNRLLVHVREVDSRGQLTSLVDSPRQPKIDLAVQTWNQALALLYESIAQPIPTQSRRGTITLETGKTLYPLPDGFVHVYWPLRHAQTALQDAQGWRIYQYAPEEADGGYMRMWDENLFPANTEGRPQRAVITPDTRELLLDRVPTDEENGDIYEFQYSIRRYLSNKDDTFPCPDAVVDALVPVAAELWRSDYQNAVSSGVLGTFLGQAARRLNPRPLRKHW